MAEETVEILDREYRIACEPDEVADLRRSAVLVDKHMREIRQGSKALGNERIAVMTALNIAHDLLRGQNDVEHQHDSIEQRLKLLQAKIDTALEGHVPQLHL